jgi:hypothetical protein
VASGVEGGVNFTQALCGTQEPVASVLKGEIQMGDPHENESTDTKHRDGTTRSSDESSVMEVERRCRVVWWCLTDQPLSVGGIF